MYALMGCRIKKIKCKISEFPVIHSTGIDLTERRQENAQAFLRQEGKNLGYSCLEAGSFVFGRATLRLGFKTRVINCL